MSRFLNEKYKNMIPYRLGKQPKDRGYIKVNSNETSIKPAENVYEVIKKAAEAPDMGHYSDQDATVLREAVAALYGVLPEQVFAGNGADEILSFIFQAYACTGNGICFPDITYGFYKTHANAFGIKYREIPLQEDFSISIEDYFNAGQMVVLANPNAPTGLRISFDDIRKILENNRDQIVVIDEAYVEFESKTCIPLIKEYDNLLVVHTMSKSRNIAAWHVGYAIGDADLIQELNHLKNCFNPNNINQVTLDVAVAAVKDKSNFEKSMKQKIEIRKWVCDEIKKLGFTVIDSYTNFLFATYSGIAGQEFEDKLYEEGILIRHYHDERIKDYIRISVGEKEEMERIVESLKMILASKGL